MFKDVNECHSEPITTSVGPWKMDGGCTGNTFPFFYNSLTKHGA
jgi:hypothetical protein